MRLHEMTLDRLEETLLALRKAVRYRNPETGVRHFCHSKEYRTAYIRGIQDRRRLIKEKKSEFN